MPPPRERCRQGLLRAVIDAESDEFRETLKGLEYFIPPILQPAHKEWRREGMDGLIVPVARKTGANKAEFIGLTILVSEVWPDELRVHDPGTGAVSGIRGAGSVENDEFHDIVWRIGPRRMQVLVDGEERYRGVGDYRAVVSPVGIGPAWGSRVDVESLVVCPLDPAAMDEPAGTGR